MKKILTIAGVLFCTVMFASGTGDEPTSLSGATVIKSSDGTFKLIYKSESLSNVKISIFNADNRLVYSEKISNTMGFARPYSFENLQKGDFTVVIEDGNGKTVKNISTKQLISSKLVNVLKLRSAEGKYLLTVGGRGSEALTLNIYDGAELIHSEVKSIAGDFAQVYNLSKVKGIPSFEVQHQDGTSEILEY
jgi:hypothetical protein